MRRNKWLIMIVSQIRNQKSERRGRQAKCGAVLLYHCTLITDKLDERARHSKGWGTYL